MNSSTYIENAKKTESVNYENIANRLQSKSMIRILHSALGLSTEAGEILDAVVFNQMHNNFGDCKFSGFIIVIIIII